MPDTVKVLSFLENVIDCLSSCSQDDRNLGYNRWLDEQDGSNWQEYISYESEKFNTDYEKASWVFHFLGAFKYKPDHAVLTKPVVDKNLVNWRLVWNEVSVFFHINPY